MRSNIQKNHLFMVFRVFIGLTAPQYHNLNNMYSLLTITARLCLLTCVWKFFLVFCLKKCFEYFESWVVC
jgi:hypothetical protein